MDENKPFEFTSADRDEILRNALTVQAAQMALPPKDRETLKQLIERIGFLKSPGSITVSSALYDVERRFRTTDGKDKIKQWKNIYGTLIHVDHEMTSKRGLFVIATEPTEKYPLGQEIVRTNSTEWDSLAQRMAYQAEHYGIAEKVTLRVALEHTGRHDKPTARVLHDIVYRGLDTKLFDANGQYLPPTVRWDALGVMGKPFDTSRLASFRKQQQGHQA